MQLISPIEPLRRFQIDPLYKEKLGRFKKQFTPAVVYAGQKIQGFSFQMNLPVELAKNVLELQMMLSKYNDSLSKEMGFVDFWYNSRQIFQFDNSLSEALSMTDIHDVPWSEIKMPYKNFYISFGTSGSKPFTLKSDGYEYAIDGAYIKFIKEGESVVFKESSIMIDFTSKLIRPDYQTAIDNMTPGFLLGEPTYSFILSGESTDSVKDAIDKGELNNLKHCDHMDTMNYENALNYAKEICLTGKEDIKLTAVRDKYFRGREIIKPSLEILFNCIFYLSQYPENVQIKYSDHKAKVLYKNLERATEADKKEKIKKEIYANEYSRIRFVRDNKIINMFKSIPTGKEVRTHWRRGHWRNQAHGEKHLEHKRKWIHPVLVNKDKGIAETGHIYEVQSS